MRLILLSNEFYKKYGNLPEILEKPSRPYVCLAVTIDGHTFAIPFRHHISHKHALLTGSGGLDYTKAVIVSDPKMISSATPQVDQREYNFIKTREQVIERGMRKYYLLVKDALKYPASPRYATVLKYSALKYFI